MNILVFPSDVVKMCDLGVSKKVIKGVTEAKTDIGTESFAAPEVTSRKPYTTAVDLWSLGCLLYYLCTGDTHFEDELLTLSVA